MSYFLVIILLLIHQPIGSRFTVHRIVDLPGERSTGISPAPDGSVFVLDQRGNTVRLLDKSLAVIRTIGGAGVGQTEFDDPIDITATFLLELYVVDRNNRRIQVFDKEGNYVRTWDDGAVRGLNGSLYPRACAVSGHGDVYVVETDGNRVVTIDPGGELKYEFGAYQKGKGALRTPTDIVITERDEAVVLDGDRLMFYDTFGNFLGAYPLTSGVEWKRINVAEQTITAIAPDRIALLSTDRSSFAVVRTTEIVGLPASAVVSDAYRTRHSLVILTDSTLITCFPVR